jgi:hypothetical protein
MSLSGAYFDVDLFSKSLEENSVLNHWRILALIIAVGLVPSTFSAAAEKESAPANTGQAGLSQRVVAYRIDARYDANTKSIDAIERLTYRNITGQSLQEFPFHLYLNGFQPNSTWMREGRLDSPRKWDPKHFGSIEITKLEVENMGELTSSLKFAHPDDDNVDDKTVVQVWLPKPIRPGTEVTFLIRFHDQLPEVFSRTGYKGDFVMGAQWFPKVGVWWRGHWNCHQFHAHSEFFADFGTYDVTLTVPQNYVVGSSGNEVSSANNPDGTKTVTLRGDAIHDFAWTADPNYRVVEDAFRNSAGVVKIRILMQPGTFSQWPRYMQALKGAMKLFDEWYGPYPYDRITVVDPPPNTAAGGMEYPTLVTTGTAFLRAKAVLAPEAVTVHEFGHQYWYGMVATNEFEDPWLDEGINSYAEVKVMNSLYGPDSSVIRFPGITAGRASFERVQYAAHADTDPVVRPAYGFISGMAYGSVVYSKSATVLLTLEGMLGEDTMRRVLRAWFTRYRFEHPTTGDFLRTVQEVSGKDLAWFFSQAVYGTQVLDYEVLELNSDPVKWYSNEKADDGLFRSYVLLHRKGDFIFPVEVEIRFDNGERVREQWDGRDRWVRFMYEKKTRVIAAEIDPGHKVWLDVDWFNNSRTVQPDGSATNKLLAYYMLIVQFLSQALAWLA